VHSQTGFIRQTILLGISLIMLFAVVNIYKLAPASADSSIPEIRSGIAGYCLDDHHDGQAANAMVDIWACNGTVAQDWTVTANAIKHGKTQCLDVQGNGKTQDDQIVLNTCDGAAGEAWTIDLGGFENPPSGLCLVVPGSKIGKQLLAASCGSISQVNEAWSAGTWSENNDANTSCNTGTEGQKVACYAEQQWAAWQSGSPSHATLLSDYTDGNSYEQWCADFVSYVYQEAGYPFTNGERGSGGWDEYDATNIQNMDFTMHPAAGYSPQPGDVAFFDYPGGHVEIVVTGGSHPTFIYGDSGTTDPATGNGEMNEDTLTSDGSAGQVTYYLSPN
jgi:hypothetical protein